MTLCRCSASGVYPTRQEALANAESTAVALPCVNGDALPILMQAGVTRCAIERVFCVDDVPMQRALLDGEGL